MCVDLGMGTLRATLSSVLVFTGSAQFAAIGVLASGGAQSAAITSGILLNLRYLALGTVVAPYVKGGPLRRAAESHLVVDESVAMASASPDPARARWFLLVTGASILVAWTTGTFVGAVLGDVVGDIERFGLDAAFPAIFVALLAPRLRDLDGRLAAAIGAVIALAVIPFTRPGVPVLLAALAVIPPLVRRR